MRTIRKGTNGYTCMPDNPDSPGPDPMCADKGGMAWTMAWVSHKDPPKGVIGFGYMLAGGSDPDNIDPGVSEILCAGPGFHQVLTKRSPNMMANWVFASAHSRGGIFHC